MPIYNGYPQTYYQQPQGQLEQLRAAQYQPQPVMMPAMQAQAAPEFPLDTHGFSQSECRQMQNSRLCF